MGAFVCVHSTVSVYKNNAVNSDFISLNLIAVQVVAVPKHG